MAFATARRFVCISGWPKYLAFYDLAGIGVLDSPFYTQAAWSSFSPWTKRMLGKVRGQYRASGDQIYPGDALTGECARLILIRFRLNPSRHFPSHFPSPTHFRNLRWCW